MDNIGRLVIENFSGSKPTYLGKPYSLHVERGLNYRSQNKEKSWRSYQNENPKERTRIRVILGQPPRTELAELQCSRQGANPEASDWRAPYKQCIEKGPCREEGEDANCEYDAHGLRGHAQHGT